jgi:hypothetical protein
VTSDLAGSAPGTGSGTASESEAGGFTPGAPVAHGRGYGNIYTPHAGSMIIQVQRESGLQSRTIVLSARQIRILRFIMSRSGKLVAAGAAVIAVLLVAEAARVPALTGRISHMEHTAQRLDTLERSLSELQRRYDQVRTMMGGDAPGDGEHPVSAAPGFTPAPAIRTRAPASSPLRATARAVTATDAVSDPASGPGSADASGTAAGATGTEPPADSGGAAIPAATPRRGRAHGAAGAASPQNVVVPPPPDSGTPPSPQAEPQ